MGVAQFVGRSFMLVLVSEHLAQYRKEEPGRPAAHQDAGECFDPAKNSPLIGQHEIAISSGRICHNAEIEGGECVGHSPDLRVG